MAGKFSIYKYVKLAGKGWRYARAAYHPNGRNKPNVVILKGQEEKHMEGSYFLSFNNQWLPVGGDPLEAQRTRAMRLAQMEYERLSRKAVAPTQTSRAVEVAGERKLIQVEVDAYLANLELAQRPHKTIISKRRFLVSFLNLVPRKRFVDEFERDDVLKFRNVLMAVGRPRRRVTRRHSSGRGVVW
jgi:hypothetical protein